MHPLKERVEQGAFDCFSFLGGRLGIASSRIRLFFIYTTFVAADSPGVLASMIVDFWKNMTRFVSHRRNRVWDV